ncbi:MAG TPA: SHOCT domain-containing protein [Candidatus Dormibacteraeota bacterium]|nr:SHOCT domain-containing protein [Candidatus Dormibacteraeota bacterium]
MEDCAVHYWGFGLWWIFPLVFGTLWVLLIAGIFFRFRRFGGRGGPHWHSASATDLLRERYARGDIDEAEYDKRLRVLEGR